MNNKNNIIDIILPNAMNLSSLRLAVVTLLINN